MYLIWVHVSCKAVLQSRKGIQAELKTTQQRAVWGQVTSSTGKMMIVHSIFHVLSLANDHGIPELKRLHVVLE